MKVLILAGGFGTRLSEETGIKPKPMVEIGEKPILWHIMKQYSHYGFNEFIILLGYKGYSIKEYFVNYVYHNSSITVDLKNNSIEVLKNDIAPWKVTLLDTGLETMTGGRIKKAQDLIGNEPFLLTYGDGVSDINIHDLVNYHKKHKGLITMSSVQPEGRFGSISLKENHCVSSFIEKPKGEQGWINGGFFVCEPEVLNYIGDEIDCVFEKKPLENLAKDNKLFAYKHNGFWRAMDTLKDKNDLNNFWKENKAPWKIWK